MPKLAGRGVFFAALAVPFALVAAPLTASAEGPDDVVITEETLAGAVATPDAAAAMASATTTTAVEDTWSGPGPDWSYAPEPLAVTSSSDDGEEEDVAEEVSEAATEDDSEESTETAVEDAVEQTSTEAVAVVAPAYEVDAVEHDDDVIETADEWVGATYSDVAAHAGPDGAWVSSTESGAVSGDDDGFPGSDGTAAWYEEATAAAGSDGAYVESTETGAFESDGWGHGNVFDGDDDLTGASYEHTAAAAGEDGAWVENVEAAALETD